MIIHGNEVLEPEELARLGKVFDEAWASVSPAAGGGAPSNGPSWRPFYCDWPI